MASLSRDGNKNWRILFMAGDGTRKVVRLSGANQSQAEKFRDRLESVVTATIIGQIDDDIARWLAGLPDEMHKRLASVGLVKARERSAATLGKFLADYFAGLSVKGGTSIAYGHARRCLLEYFGAERPLKEIEPADADKWKQWLKEQKVGRKPCERNLSAATVARRVGTARMFFGRALRWKLIGGNPFADVKAGSQTNKARQRMIPRDVADKVMEACPDAQWRLLFALSRYGGLRCPSEHFGLKWGDIDFDRGTIRVTSPKTEHHEGGDERVIPMFPELRGPLMDVFTEAEPGSEHVITRYRQPNCNLRTQLHRIIRKAGLIPWPKPFHNLRATRQTELSEQFPAHVVCQWIGNSLEVAQDHYLQVTDEHFAKAQKAAQQSSADIGLVGKPDKVASAENEKRPGNSEPCLSVPILADSSTGRGRIRTFEGRAIRFTV